MQEVIHEKDIFRGYEVRNWDFSPKIYKILAVSALINIVGIAIFSQTNLLTKKGCDSPFVSTVCQVLDTIYVGNRLFGTDGDYVVKEYNKTDIGEGEEIILINAENISLPSAYPPGYFAVSNPDQYQLDESGNVVAKNAFENITPGIPNMDSPLINTPPNLPPPNNNPTTGNVPDSPWTIVNEPSRAGTGKKGGKNPTLKDDSPTDLPKLGGDETADNKKDPKVDEKTAKNSDPVKAVETNRKPVDDLVDIVLAKSEKNDHKLVLKPFKVVLNSKLEKKEITEPNGEVKEIVKFSADKKITKWNTKAESGDAELVKLGREAIEAVGNSGFLGYLYNLGAEDIQITLEQVGDSLQIVVRSNMKTKERVASMIISYDLYMKVNPPKLKGEDEILLLDSLKKPTGDGTFFVIEAEMTKVIAEEMIQRNLKKAAEKKPPESKPNSTANVVNSNSNTGK